jgi:hypothetical protein
MNFLGMAENVERFLRLLQQAKIWCLEDILYLTKEDCMDLQLPWDLITALQKRTKVWRMEMIDDAEKGLEQGEKHYQVADDRKMQSMKLMNAPDNSEDGNPNAIKDAASEDASQSGSEQQPNGFFANGFTTSHMVTGNAMGKKFPFGTMEPYTVKDPNCLTSEQFEQRLEKLENRLFEKLEHSLHGFTRQIDMSHDRFAIGMNDMGKAMEKSQGKLQANVEQALAAQSQALAAQSHQQDTFATGLQSQLQGMQDFAESVFQRTTEANERQIAAAENERNFTTQTIQNVVNGVNMQMQEMVRAVEELKDTQHKVGGTMTQMSDSWAQMVIQDFKATAFTLQTKMNQQDEEHYKKQGELEERITRAVEMLVMEGNGNLRNTVDEKLQGFSDRLTNKMETSIEVQKTAQMNTMNAGSGELKDISHLIRGMGQDCAKNIEVGIGFFSNSLRSQLESMQSQQHQQFAATEDNMAKKLDAIANRMQEQSLQHAQKLDSRLETNIHESAAKVVEEQRKCFLEVKTVVEETTQGQKEKAQDMHSMLAAVLEQTIGAKDRSAECSDKVSRLWEELGYHEPHPSPLARSQTRPFSAVGGSSQQQIERSTTRQSSVSGSRYSQYGAHVMNS